MIYYSQDGKKASTKPGQQPIKSFDFHTWDKYDAEGAAKAAEEEDEEGIKGVATPPVHLPAVVSERGTAGLHNTWTVVPHSIEGVVFITDLHLVILLFQGDEMICAHACILTIFMHQTTQWWFGAKLEHR